MSIDERWGLYFLVRLDWHQDDDQLISWSSWLQDWATVTLRVIIANLCVLSTVQICPILSGGAKPDPTRSIKSPSFQIFLFTEFKTFSRGSSHQGEWLALLTPSLSLHGALLLKIKQKPMKIGTFTPRSIQLLYSQHNTALLITFKIKYNNLCFIICSNTPLILYYKTATA